MLSPPRAKVWRPLHSDTSIWRPPASRSSLGADEGADWRGLRNARQLKVALFLLCYHLN